MIGALPQASCRRPMHVCQARPALLALQRPQASFLGQRLQSTPARQGHCVAAPASTGLVVVAAQNTKQRQRLAIKERTYNRQYKSAVRTRMKKVVRRLSEYSLSPPQSEEDLKPVDTFISEAYKEIDKAVKRGIYHVNNGARKKSRLALARQKLLIACGLYKPAATASMSSVDRA